MASLCAEFFEWTDVTGMARLLEFDPCQTTVAPGGLVSKSLLSVEIEGGQLRYRLFESAKRFTVQNFLRWRPPDFLS